MRARRFSREELDEIIDAAIKLQNDILRGEITISDALKEISGDVYIEEPKYSVGGTPDAPELIEEQGMTVEATGEAFDRYMDWVARTWDADKLVTKYVITLLGMPEKLARPAIVPYREDGQIIRIFRCDTCDKPLLTGGVVMNNNLRCSVQCLGWWEKDRKNHRSNPDDDSGRFAACGDCFRWAHKEASFNGGTLIHGWVIDRAKRRIWGVIEYGAHAWVERDGLVYDWQRCDQGYGKCPITVRHFNRMYRPLNVRRYPGTPKLIGKAYHEGHYGPWHEECSCIHFKEYNCNCKKRGNPWWRY